MKNISKILGLILTTALLAVILAVGIFAVEEGYTKVATGTCFPGSTVTWTVYNNGGEQLLEFTGKGTLKVIDLDKDGAYVQPVYNPSAALKYNLYIPWAEHVPNIKKIIVGDGIYAIDPYALAIHKYVQTVELGKDVVSLGNKAFMGCNALRTIYRKGAEPKEGTLDLTGITYLGDQLFDYCTSFSNIILPTEGSYTLKTKFITNNNALTSLYIPAACTKVEAEAITYCSALTSIAYENNKKTVEAAGAFANNASNPTTYTPSTVTVKVAGKDDITVSTAYMSNLLQVEDTTYVVYSDEQCTTLYPNTIIKEPTTVYAKMLFEFVGCQVRVEDHNGLRFIYECNPYAFSGLKGYTISMGALGAKLYGVDPILNHAYNPALLENTEIIVDEVFTGKFISHEGDSYRFAHTAVGYGDKDEDGGTLLRSRVATEILSRAYVILKNADGEQTVLYTPQYKNDLNNACDKTMTAGASSLTDDQKAFVQDLLNLGADPNKIYTKAEALAHLTDMYNDSEHILSGQHLLSNTPTTVKDTLQKVYENSGELPAVLSYDAAKGYRSYKDKSAAEQAEIIADLVDQFKQYAKQGGLITFCAHLTNPADSTQEYRGSFDDWDNLWDNYPTFTDEINGIVEIMLAMKEAGIPIFWRPYHEMNMISANDKFWWCNLSSPEFKELWSDTYKYFVTDNGLDNLIWIYSPNMSTSSGVPNTDLPVLNYYEDIKDKVDVMGVDWYITTDTENGGKLIYKNLSSQDVGSLLSGTGKPVVYGEFGPRSKIDNVVYNADPSLSYNCRDAHRDLKLVNNDAKWNMGWTVFWSSNNTFWMSLEDMYYADEFMKDDFIYTLAESKAAFFD